jgi:hypothetical protein
MRARGDGKMVAPADREPSTLSSSGGNAAVRAWAFSFYYFYYGRSGRLPHAGSKGNA